MADVYHPDTQEILSYSPRNMLKEAVKKADLPAGIITQIMFSFVLHKYGKDEKEKHHSSNKGMLTLE